MIKFALLLVAAVPLLAAASALAQVQAAPTPGCTATPAQLDANRKAAIAFYRRGITADERLVLLDPSYIQHNPRFKKYAVDNKVSDIEAFKALMGQGGGGGGAPGDAAPPQGDPLAIVTAECDLVTIVHKNFRQDPTAPPGTWFEAYTFDTFRVKNGKLTEHWDSAVIAPPAPAR
jgi:predicted SnoaL-like aldol condensation-catalyzing enzyme